MPARFPESTIGRDSRQTINGNERWNSDDEIVISGLSGRLPESANIEEFKQQLFDGVDLVTDDERRWPSGIHGLPTRNGKLKNLSEFDATFFGVHAKQAHAMDPQLRIMLELTHEALIDAGVNPAEVRGSRTGVFIGVTQSESDESWCTDPDKVNGYSLIGCCRAMFPNRISYSFDFSGPSYAIDSACSSSMYAIQQAVSAMRTGQCDAAIVGGVNLLLKPTNSLQFHRLNMLSIDGTCKTFDASGKGYVRAEAAVIIYLQKSSVAKRNYATVVGTKTNTDGYKELGITFPSGPMQNKLIREVYEEAGVDPAEVVYVEAHGTGTKVGDPQEVNSIADVFCKNRKTPLLIGSVKSNMGHAEPASGLCSIAKVVIAMEAGVIPTNLHFHSPNPDIAALVDGSLKVVSENQPWNGGYAAINSFGFGGANAHVILKSNPKPKLNGSIDTIPRLLTVSGRTEAAVNSFIDKLQTVPDDDELLALIYDIHKNNIVGHGYRGYSFVGDQQMREVMPVTGGKRPIWFVYSGMGSQWSGMGKDLIKLDMFKNAISKSSHALKPHGINLEQIILHADGTAFENVLNSFVAITAVQIALTDVLTSLDIYPDGIVGHSVGEVGCAYADGAFTAEQTILAAYSRGKSILESQLPLGAMAAVGLSWDECKRRCPPGIVPACHNSADNVTISGPPDPMKKFVDELTAENIFARVINSSGKAFHSKYITDAGPKLRKALDAIIPNPKPRSSRWISSSIPESAWGTPVAQLSSSAYHVNNLLSPVLFHEAIQHIPDNAIVIEIAPHCILQAILKRSLGPNCSSLGLMKREHDNNLQFFLSSLGKMYNAGAQPKVARLYQPISYPVGRGTPMLASMIEWDHSMQWDVASFAGKGARSGECVIDIDLSKDADKYLSGHAIDGRILFPATGYLTLVWKTFAKLRNADFEKTPVIIENVQFHRATVMPKEGSVKFLINIFEGTGDFELCEGGTVTVSGNISFPEDMSKEMINLPKPHVKKENDVMDLKTADIYKDLRLRGYDYDGIFRGIHESDNRGISGSLKWENNWISFIDTMLQFSILGQNTRELYLPTRLQRVVIDPKQHLDYIAKLEKKESPLLMPVNMYRDVNIIKCGGIELRGIKLNLAPNRPLKQSAPKLEKYLFVPYENNQLLNQDFEKSRIQGLTVLLQTVIENSAGTLKLKVTEIATERQPEALLAPLVIKTIEAEPMFSVVYSTVSDGPIESYATAFEALGIKTVQKDVTKNVVDQNVNLVIAHDLLSQNAVSILENAVNSLKPGGMILLEEINKSVNMQTIANMGMELIGKQIAGPKMYLLIRKTVEIDAPNSLVIKISESTFDWVESLKDAMKQSETDNTKIYLVVQNEELTGMMGLTTCVMREPGGSNVRSVFIQDKKSEMFSLTATFFAKQLKKDLVFNVLKNGVWGTYRHITLDTTTDSGKLQVEHAYINALTRGDLSSFRWIEGPLRYYKNDNPKAELCSVYYAPLNFRDIMLASGKLPPDALPGDLAGQDCILGLEFSGRDTQGRRVMGMVAARSLATTVLADPGFMWEVPEQWSLEEAATVPVAYGTSYYALVVRGRIKPGESVLIHAGTGGVGQAAIAIALHMGCTVFTTCGTQAKRDFLKQRFPQLTSKHVGNSRDTSFEQLVRQQTNGNGVDLVLNSLAEEKLQASIRCLAKHGRFLEIGKVDFSNDNPLGMSIFLNNITFHGILLDALFDSDNPDKNEVMALVTAGIKSGAVRPLPATVFTENQVEASFRFIATGKHIGKVVLKIRDEESRQAQKPAMKLVPAIPRTYMDQEKSYVLVGGLGGFGLELANWLITRGAKNLVFTSRSGIRNGYQSLCIRRWQEMNVNITISTADATTDKGARELLIQANKLGPVGGIFNLAAVWRDALMENQSMADFKTVCLPKIDATKNLDSDSRAMCPHLDYFIVFSSVFSGRGNPGQVNYGFANSAMERICEARQAAGLPGLAIQWGLIGDVGLVIETLGNNETELAGMLPQRMSSCLQTIDNFMQQPHPVMSCMVLADKHGTSTGNEVGLIDAIANILGVKDSKTIQPSVTLADLGMDSIMGSEIKQTLARNYDLVLSAQEIRNVTFGKLMKFSSGGSLQAEPTAANTDNAEVQYNWPEIMPSNPIIQMKSKAASNEVAPLFILHPFDGVVNALAELVQELSIPVYGLQCTASAPLDSIGELSKYYVKLVRTVQLKGPYSICGYSFGACVAFEMATQLENEGETVKLILLDGSPNYIDTHIGKRKLTSGDNKVNESEALTHFLLQFKDIEQAKIIEELNSLKNWETRLDRSTEMLKGVVPFPAEQLKAAASSFYHKLVAADKYKPTRQFKGEITLLRAKDNYVQLGDDYGLNAICKQKVTVLPLEGNHRSILVGPAGRKAANIIHSFITNT